MDLQGFNQALLDHNSYAQSVINQNNIIKAHNDMVLKNFNDAEKSRKESATIDDIWHGISDPLKSAYGLMNLASTIGQAKNYEGGVSAYIADQTKGRVGDIIQGYKTLTASKPQPTGDVLGATPSTSPQALETQARLNIFGAGQEGQTIFGSLTDQQKGTLVERYGNPSQTNLDHLQGLKDSVTTAGGDSSDLLGKVLSDAPPAPPPPVNKPISTGGANISNDTKSTIPTSLEDVVSRTAGAFGMDPAKSAVIGNVAGKIGGISGGISGIYDQLTDKDASGLQKASDVFSEVGAGLDVVGTAIPVLEPLGAVASTIGGILGGISDVQQSAIQKASDIAQKTEGMEQFVTSQLSTKGAIGGATRLQAQSTGGSYSF